MTKQEYLQQTFESRGLPEAIWINDDCIPGPFCKHCGNPWLQHGPDNRCPNQHLHPLYPPPRLPFALRDTDIRTLVMFSKGRYVEVSGRAGSRSPASQETLRVLQGRHFIEIRGSLRHGSIEVTDAGRAFVAERLKENPDRYGSGL